MLAVKLSTQVCGKYPANRKDVFWVIMDLEKAFDTIDRHDMSQMLSVYRVELKLLNACVKNFYVDSMTCVRVKMDVSEWCPVNT